MQQTSAYLIPVITMVAGAAHADHRWASPLAPLPGSVVELDVGLGGGLHLDPPPFGVAAVPDVLLGARWGITDSIQVALPLLATVSTEVGDGWPRLSMTAGLAWIGYSSVLGVIVAPTIGAAAHFIGPRQAVVISADSSSYFTAAGVRTFADLGFKGGLALRLDDAWSVGMSAGMSTAAQSFGNIDRGFLRASLGSRGGQVPADVPTVRWLLTNNFSLELWTFLVMTSETRGASSANGLSDAGANVSVTWRL